MGTTTANYDLIKPDLTDFIDVTELNDNFDVIDTELKNCMDAASLNVSSKIFRYTLSLSTAWNGNDPYTQVVTIPGATITANSKVDLQPDSEVLASLIEDGVKAIWIENNNGTLTAKAIGHAPSDALTMQCTISDTGTAVTGIDVTAEPTKNTYVAGTALDLTGLEVTATYSDGTTDVVTDECTSIPADGQALMTIGTQTVTVSYAYNGVTKTDTFDVTVIPVLDSIEVTSIPETTTYTVGDSLELTGLEVTATYSDGETADITENCEFDPDEGDTLSVIGEYEVLVSYTENNITKSTSFSITVEASE